MKTKLAIAMMAATLVTGCATAVPAARTFPPAEQKKALSVKHWEFIAGDVVRKTRLAMTRADFPTGKPFYVIGKDSSDFTQAFRKYIITALVDAGLPVSERREGAVEIVYEAQVIKHPSAFDPKLAGYKPGMATVGIAGFWILRDAFRTWPSSSLAVATTSGAAGVDTYQTLNPGETGVELVLTTSISHHDMYLMHATDGYYIEKADAYLFKECDRKFWSSSCK